MDISDILNDALVNINLKGDNKNEIINELCDNIVSYWNIDDKKDFINKILEREEIKSTGIGRGVALPHARTDAVKGVVISFGRKVEGIDYDSLDGKPAQLFFMIASSSDSSNDYIKVLSNLSKLLRMDEFREELLNARDKSEIINIIRKYENK